MMKIPVNPVYLPSVFNLTTNKLYDHETTHINYTNLLLIGPGASGDQARSGADKCQPDAQNGNLLTEWCECYDQCAYRSIDRGQYPSEYNLAWCLFSLLCQESHYHRRQQPAIPEFGKCCPATVRWQCF